MITVLVMFLFYGDMQKYDDEAHMMSISLYHTEESHEIQVLTYKKVTCYS